MAEFIRLPWDRGRPPDPVGGTTNGEVPGIPRDDPLWHLHAEIHQQYANFRKLTHWYYDRARAYRAGDTQLRIGASAASIVATGVVGLEAAFHSPGLAVVAVVLTASGGILTAALAILRPHEEAARFMNAYLDLEDAGADLWAEWRRASLLTDPSERELGLLALPAKINHERAKIARKHGEVAAEMLRRRGQDPYPRP